ncbi:hypothetical protein [Oceanobacter kriegii]|uniref:hypothetical protein n=1 Tax=Oceanobacter kriegii TaxID=64972 RepID=UPI000416DA4A|nr:hypothetical protein [Oceanobacter kriegii]
MKNALLAGSALLPSLALAHPGHDHGHWMSGSVHAITAVAIVAVLATGAWFVRSRLASRKSNEEK